MNDIRKLAPRFKRRLVTIMAGDVAAFCRLMGADDEVNPVAVSRLSPNP